MVTVTEVTPRSRAARRGIRVGDILLTVNGHPIRDVLDYRFYLAEETVVLTLHRGERIITKKIRKEIYDDIGLGFETALMDKKQSCRNGCIFCFIDQLPRGMRESLYFKDDDARLSFLHGNYVTLTNLTDEDIDRIIEMHISPINVSVHTTNPELRVRMMRNKRAGEVLSYLDRLAEAGITLRAQIVLCRGINDGEELLRSMQDLSRLYPALDSVSVVPAGLTAHREGLYPLTAYTKEEAGEVLDMIEAFATRHYADKGSRLLFAADELYLRAGRPLPPEEAYEEYPQMENGVGMLRSFYEEAEACLEGYACVPRPQRTVSVATGLAAAPMLREIAEKVAAKHGNLTSNVYEIRNHWFGESVTVAGLLTGHDVAEQLAGLPLGEVLLLSRSMLRAEGDLFLCGMSPRELEEKLGVRIAFIGEDGAAFVDALLGED
ncbi:MAG: DUF512 domain-containing protein [Clostridia bacterium]|nr:DUF512 domain-containing protein [Clostridia bacterium]